MKLRVNGLENMNYQTNLENLKFKYENNTFYIFVKNDLIYQKIVFFLLDQNFGGRYDQSNPHKC